MARPSHGRPAVRARYVIVWSRLTEIVALAASALGVLAAATNLL